MIEQSSLCFRILVTVRDVAWDFEGVRTRRKVQECASNLGGLGHRPPEFWVSEMAFPAFSQGIFSE